MVVVWVQQNGFERTNILCKSKNIFRKKMVEERLPICDKLQILYSNVPLKQISILWAVWAKFILLLLKFRVINAAQKIIYNIIQSILSQWTNVVPQQELSWLFFLFLLFKYSELTASFYFMIKELIPRSINTWTYKPWETTPTDHVGNNQHVRVVYGHESNK